MLGLIDALAGRGGQEAKHPVRQAWSSVLLKNPMRYVNAHSWITYAILGVCYDHRRLMVYEAFRLYLQYK